MTDDLHARIAELERQLAEARATVGATKQQVARAIVESERRFRLLVEWGAEIVLITGPRVFGYVSPSAERVLGYTPDELVGTDPAALLFAEDLPSVVALFARARTQPLGSAAPIRVRIRHKDGTYRVLEGVVRNLTDEPTVGGLVTNLRDVTERERTQEILERSEATLRESQALLETAERIAKVGGWTWAPPDSAAS